MTRLKFVVVSQNHVLAEVLLMHIGEDGREIKRETCHISWRPNNTWQDNHGRKYPLPPPAKESGSKEPGKNQHRLPTSRKLIVVTLVRSFGPGEGLFEIKETDKPKRLAKLIQIRGDQWRLAQGNKFYHVRT